MVLLGEGRRGSKSKNCTRIDAKELPADIIALAGHSHLFLNVALRRSKSGAEWIEIQVLRETEEEAETRRAFYEARIFGGGDDGHAATLDEAKAAFRSIFGDESP